MVQHLFVIALSVSLGASRVGASDTLDRTVGLHPVRGELRLTSRPLVACAYVLEVASAAGIPAGCEEFSASVDTPSIAAEQVPLSGLTVRDAMNEITASFTAYEWKLVDDVVVVRPSTSWNNLRHYLHQTVPVAYWGRVSLNQIFTRIATMWRGHSPTIPNDGFLEVHEIDVNVPGGSFLSLVTGIVRQDGRLTWRIGYREVAHDKSSFYLEIATLEGRGGGIQLPNVRHARNGVSAGHAQPAK
jgi:hypothetical protein